MTGPLDKIKEALQQYTLDMQTAGLALNPSDSCTYIPPWRRLSPDNLKTQPGVRVLDDQTYFIDMGNGEFFPLELTGIKTPGFPIGTQTYCENVISSTIANIEADFQLLKDIKWFHQQAKQTIHCCNTHITYLICAAQVHHTLHLAKVMDETFGHLMADLLSFESGYAISQMANHYANALQPCRLKIKQGGLGLTQAAPITPAANYVALREFYCRSNRKMGR